jgi:hypothetical protein
VYVLGESESKMEILAGAPCSPPVVYFNVFIPCLTGPAGNVYGQAGVGICSAVAPVRLAAHLREPSEGCDCLAAADRIIRESGIQMKHRGREEA